MIGTVYDYNDRYIKILSGEKRKIIFFKDNEYEEAINKGMEIDKQVIFDDKKDKIVKFI